jgi:hypothetical protein
MGHGSREACHRARIRATTGRDDMMCVGDVRTGVGRVPGLNNKPGHDEARVPSQKRDQRN